MDLAYIREFLHAIKIEMLRFRYWIVLAFILLSSAALLAHYVVPKTYTSKVILYADVTNIIGNLLEGKAEITKIDRAKEARDIIFTDRILRSVGAEAGFSDPDAAIRTLRSRMRISASGDYVNIEYSSSSRDRAFSIVHAVTQAFLSETARKKRDESKSAFDFVDAQVNTYKSQLEEAEQALKAFSAENIDITEQSVSSRVIRYKNDIQLLELEIQDSQARLASYNEQLAIEPEFLQIEVEREMSFKERQLEDYEQRLADMRLTYLDTHPDIISLKDQTAELQAEVDEIRASAASTKNFSQIENPSYTNLKEVINSERAALTASRNRLSNTQKLLQAEMANAETVASKQAKYKELTRDYSVTKQVYEDMLKTRESARLSMTLDIEGQGISYKIHEPASYPLNSNGLQLIHYAVIGPLLGITVPLGLIVLLILMDNRVRSAQYMSDNLPAHIQLITTIPMYDGAVMSLASRRSLIFIGLIMVLYIGLYTLLSINPSLISLIRIGQ